MSLFLAAGATVAIILVFDATVHTTPPPLPPGTAMPAFVDSNPGTNADALRVVDRSHRTRPDKPPDDFNPMLPANNAYPDFDYDLQAIESGNGIGLAPESTAPETSSASVKNKSASASNVPEPATMFLVGSGLISLAVFARKLKKR